jgi:hypothetical protein
VNLLYYDIIDSCLIVTAVSNAADSTKGMSLDVHSLHLASAGAVFVKFVFFLFVKDS